MRAERSDVRIQRGIEGVPRAPDGRAVAAALGGRLGEEGELGTRRDGEHRDGRDAPQRESGRSGPESSGPCQQPGLRGARGEDGRVHVRLDVGSALAREGHSRNARAAG